MRWIANPCRSVRFRYPPPLPRFWNLHISRWKAIFLDGALRVSLFSTGQPPTHETFIKAVWILDLALLLAPPTWIQEMDLLIADWTQANETCRGSSDPVAGPKACRARNLITVQLHDIGLCEGAYALDIPDFATATMLREHWVPCFYPDLQN